MMATKCFVVMISKIDLLHSVNVMIICHFEHLVVRLDMLLGKMAHILRRRVMLPIAGDSPV